MHFSLFKFFYQDDLDGFRAALEGSIVGGKRGFVPISPKDLNRTDEYGRTVLHLACSQNRIEFVKCLLNTPGIDILAADFESGWTALHRALYAGNIAIGQLLICANRETIRIKDREGNSPFDVLNSTIDGTNPNALDVNIGGSELFTFGSNANHTLGFNDSDDRANPERIYIERPNINSNKAFLDRYKPVRIRDVQMSKLHTIVLTTEPTNNLYVCGFGNGGRLGFPTGSTQFTLKNLSAFGRSQVVAVSLSQDHTIVALENGECYTWGSNKYGQLGYPVDTKKPQDEPIQPIPRRIVNGLKKENVIGVAASKTHSIAFTCSDLFTWGKNDGQLGFPVSESSTIEMYPRKVPSLPCPIKMVTATDKATICLLSNNDVIVFVNGGYFKVYFPLERFADQFSVFRPRGMYAKNTITKIVSGGNTVGALSSLGDVYSFQLDSKSIGSIKPSQLTRSIKPQNVWSLRRKHLAVRDLSISQDGSVIICTKSGSVWRKTKRHNTKNSHGNVSEYKFTRIPHLTQAVAVRSNMFGSYAAIRSDGDVPPIDINSRDLIDDIEPLISFVEWGEDDIESVASLNSETSVPTENDRRPPQTYFATLKLLQQDEEILLSNLRQMFEDIENEGLFYDLYLTSADNEGVLIPAHKIIVGSRSKILMNLLSNTEETPTAGISYTESTGKSVLKFESGLLAVLLFTYFAYTDYLLPVWEGFKSKANISKKFLKAKDDLTKIAHTLKLKRLSSAVYFMQKSDVILSSDVLEAVADVRTEEWTDLILELKDREIPCHSVILSARSPFFEALTAVRWTVPAPNFTTIDDYDEKRAIKKVDMKHVQYSVFRTVLDFIYGSNQEALFSEVCAEDLSEFLEYVLDVMSVANELMIDKLSQICQSIIVSFVDVRNVSDFLMEADAYSAERLKNSLLIYVTRNLECMLENGLLGDLDYSLWECLDKVVKTKQAEKLPVSKSEILLNLLEERHPNLTESRKKERAQLANFFETSLSSSYGSLPLHSPFPGSLSKSAERRPSETGGSGGSRRRRRGSRDPQLTVAQTSPLIRPTAGSAISSDLIFDMEEEQSDMGWVTVKNKESKLSLTSSPPLRPIDDHNLPSGSLTRDIENLSFTSDRQSFSSHHSVSHGVGMVTPNSISFKSKYNESASGGVPNQSEKSWTPVTNKITPIDFKSTGPRSEVPKKSPTVVSGLSMGLRQRNWPTASEHAKMPTAETHATSASISKQPGVDDFSMKLSQKARKKQRQRLETSSPANKQTNSSPWQTPMKDAQIRSLRDYENIDSVSNRISNPHLYPSGPQTSFATTAAQNLSQVSTPSIKKSFSSVQTTGKNFTTSPMATPSRNSPTQNKTSVSASSNGGLVSTSSSYVASSSPLQNNIEYHFSLAEIIEQEQNARKLEADKAKLKKSIKEIQEEEEFAAWWARESERVQMEMKQQEQTTSKFQSVISNGSKDARDNRDIKRYNGKSAGRGSTNVATGGSGGYLSGKGRGDKQNKYNRRKGD
ncbi:hypothetical protein V1511DRAFT_455374 [Dipodascopsis uninucleata]